MKGNEFKNIESMIRIIRKMS